MLAAGVPDLKVRIDGYSRWRAATSVAQVFQDRRTFLIGDAAHLMPPNGGFGGNTGIHDAHNIAWKLALVVAGQADARLLESYASERKPVAEFTVEQAFSRYVARTAPWLAASQRPEPIVDDLRIELGYLYDSPLGTHMDPRAATGMPGARAPRLWLRRAGRRIRLALAFQRAVPAGRRASALLGRRHSAAVYSIDVLHTCPGRYFHD